MTVRTRSLVVAGFGLALVIAGSLTACATPAGPGSGTGAVSPTGGETPSAAPSADSDIEAAWLDGGRMIGLVTYGSSTCLPTATVGTVGGGVLEVELVDDPEAVCTRDLVPRVTLLPLAGEVDPTQDLEIRVTGETYRGDVDLDGIPGLDPSGETDYQPSAGWADDDGRFVALTWGSSGCPPVLESATATAPTEVTVTFATPPADQVCTMDLAPRGTVVQVDGDLDDDAEVFAILTGAGFDSIRVPILGSD